ncbi:hypothetical protein [Marinicrinis lubricantis]|uniref:Uncharacterized protein n=1 Tax=Marinicrinis lubricantis TaxID=2086470 RepID=A0ABW1IQ19_9BACL
MKFRFFLSLLLLFSMLSSVANAEDKLTFTQEDRSIYYFQVLGANIYRNPSETPKMHITKLDYSTGQYSLVEEIPLPELVIEDRSAMTFASLFINPDNNNEIFGNLSDKVFKFDYTLRKTEVLFSIENERIVDIYPAINMYVTSELSPYSDYKIYALDTQKLLHTATAYPVIKDYRSYVNKRGVDIQYEPKQGNLFVPEDTPYEIDSNGTIKYIPTNQRKDYAKSSFTQYFNNGYIYKETSRRGLFTTDEGSVKKFV